jgi:hypothetical protein
MFTRILAFKRALPSRVFASVESYRRYALVQPIADTLGIGLLYLLAYLPNLGSIERLSHFSLSGDMASQLGCILPLQKNC